MHGNRYILFSFFLLLCALGLALLPVYRTADLPVMLEPVVDHQGTTHEFDVPEGKDVHWIVTNGDEVADRDVILQFLSVDQQERLNDLINGMVSFDQLVLVYDQLDPGQVKSWLSAHLADNGEPVGRGLMPDQLVALQSSLKELNDSLASLRVRQYHSGSPDPELTQMVQSLEKRQNGLLRKMERILGSSERPNHPNVHLTAQMLDDLVAIARDELDAGVIRAPSAGVIYQVPSSREDRLVFRIDPEPSGRHILTILAGREHLWTVQPGDTLLFKPGEVLEARDRQEVPLIITEMLKGEASMQVIVTPKEVSALLTQSLRGAGRVRVQRSNSMWRLTDELVKH